MNKKDLAIAFGERTSQDVSPNQLRVKGNWVFYRDPYYPNEAACYARSDGDCICWEPWSDVPIDQSPFKPHNEEVVSKTLEKLDKEYSAYLKEIGHE